MKSFSPLDEFDRRISSERRARRTQHAPPRLSMTPRPRASSAPGPRLGKKAERIEWSYWIPWAIAVVWCEWVLLFVTWHWRH